MNNIKQEIDKISIPKDIKRRRDIGVNLAKSEMPGKKRRWYPAIGIAISVFLLSLTLIYFNNDNPPENPTIKTIDANYMIDINDPEAVVDFADNVFVGTVEKQVDSFINNYPETQFEINVLENIKGNLNEKEVINQIGGYEGDDLFLMEGDELLKENETYLFATIDSEESDIKTIIPIGGSIMIENENGKEELVKKYKELYKGAE